MANNQRIRQAPGKSSPFVTLNPANIIANKAPTVHDQYEQGTIWFYPALNGVWALTSYAAGDAIWTFLVSAAGSVDTLTGNDAVPIAPVGGNIDIVTAAGMGLLFTNTAAGVLTLGGSLDVAFGGTGDTSFEPYGVVTGGTSSTSPLQTVSGLGTSGQILTSQGLGMLPKWVDPAASSISITGDVGGPLVGDNFTFTGGTTGLEFSGAGSTETLIGELVVPNGGTGVGTFNAYGVILGGTTATGAMQSQAPSAALGIPLISAGVAANPVFGTALVAGGGTGGVSHTAYALLAGGTTATGALQSLAGLGSAGQLLTSNGAAALPTFQAVPASSISITGDSGGALTGAAFTITGGTSGLTFAGAGSTETLGGDLVVANGGTGNTTFTAFAPVAAGTTATGPFQSVDTGIATSGFVLTSTGAGSLPTWQAAAGGGISSVVVQTFSTSGTYTPTAGMAYCTIEVVGGGGGGGATADTNSAQVSVGAGGGGGGYARLTVTAATIGASQTVTIGAAGTAGAASAGSGGAGGTTSVGAIVSATGGGGGAGAGAGTGSAATGGAGGSGSSGDFNTFGAPGINGIGTVSGVTSGSGGCSFFGGGPQGLAVLSGNSAGFAATSYGGGGGGAVCGVSGTASNGGVGAAGFVVITEYVA